MRRIRRWGSIARGSVARASVVRGSVVRGSVAVALALALAIAVAELAGCGGGSSRHSPHRSPPVPSEAPAVPAPATTAIGATVNSLFNAPLYTPAQVTAELAALRATGATLGRSDVLWEKVETQPPTNGVHHYDWTFDDGIAAALAAQGPTWLPILDYAANWAKAVPSQLHSPPRSAGLFATFARAFAARYGPGGAFWRAHPGLTPQPVTTFEVWNEPDGSFWYPAPNAAAFADLYLQTRDAIHAVAPGSRVVIGGLTHAETFLPEMLAARPQLLTSIDGVGIHIYDFGPADVLSHVAALRTLSDAHSLSRVPIYITEVGWSTSPVQPHSQFYAPARLRPGYIARIVGKLGHSNCSIGAILVYSWITPEQSKGNLQDWFGINPPPGARLPSADVTAFTSAIRKASTTRAAPARVCSEQTKR